MGRCYCNKACVKFDWVLAALECADGSTSGRACQGRVVSLLVPRACGLLCRFLKYTWAQMLFCTSALVCSRARLQPVLKSVCDSVCTKCILLSDVRVRSARFYLFAGDPLQLCVHARCLLPAACAAPHPERGQVRGATQEPQHRAAARQRAGAPRAGAVPPVCVSAPDATVPGCHRTASRRAALRRADTLPYPIRPRGLHAWHPCVRRALEVRGCQRLVRPL